MADISTRSGNGRGNITKERRAVERRTNERRKNPATSNNYTGSERRIAKSDRRTTIVNRLNRVVTDRRSNE